MERARPDAARAPRRPVEGSTTAIGLLPGGHNRQLADTAGWVPPVVCLLGLDEAGTAGGTFSNGDDLVAQTPFIGDHDPRAETRQALLEAVLAAGDHLVVTRTGHSVRTNQTVPMATVLAELRDTIWATLSAKGRASAWARIETVHPCQAFDAGCFRPGELNRAGPSNFDAGALAGALARARRRGQDPPFFAGPLAPYGEEGSVIRLEELRRFLDHPVKAFMRQRLQLHQLGENREVSDDLATSLGPLESSSGARGPPDPGTPRAARARSGAATSAPSARCPGGLGENCLDDVETTVEARCPWRPSSEPTTTPAGRCRSTSCSRTAPGSSAR